MIRTASETDLLQCPYDRAHQVMKSRFQVHLGRCRRNHKDVPKSVCPFNITHVLNEPELEWHVSTCSDRSTFENFKNRDPPTMQDIVAPKPQPVLREIESSENWDEDPDVAGYNPQAYVSRAPVLRNLQGAAPSVKKKFRQQERLRHLGIDN